MANVPDQPVARRIEEVVQCYRQFDDAEPRSEMAAGYCHRVDGLGAQFVCDLAQLLFVEPAKIGRILDFLEKQAGHDPNNILATPRSPKDLGSRYGLPSDPAMFSRGAYLDTGTSDRRTAMSST